MFSRASAIWIIPSRPLKIPLNFNIWHLNGNPKEEEKE